MKRDPCLRRFIWSILLCISVGLFAASVYRAVTFSFTIDESLSYAIFSWDPGWGATANNHPLNTLLMGLCSTVLGNSEWSLRLPNLLAHALYLTTSLLLLKRFQQPVWWIAGFAILNLNPYMLDFFFLARGYGLALAFQMLSLYLLTRSYEEKMQPAFVRHLCLSVAAGALAVLANLAFLNYYLPLLVASVWLLLSDVSLRRFSTKHLPATIGLFVASGVFLAAILFWAFQLQHSGELYFGGNSDFIEDTIFSLVFSSLYGVSYASAIPVIITFAMMGFFVAFCLFGIYLFFFRREKSLFMPFLLILILAVALPILQHLLFNILYPVARTALYYLPLYGVVLLFAFHKLESLINHHWVHYLILLLPMLMAGALGWHYYWSFNLHTCYDWAFDGHDNEVLEIINQDREYYFPDQSIQLSNSWVMEPALNFYRVTRHYTWLAQVTREPMMSGTSNYIYGYEDEVWAVPIDHFTILASYPDIRTVLLRVDQPNAPKTH